MKGVYTSWSSTSNIVTRKIGSGLTYDMEEVAYLFECCLSIRNHLITTKASKLPSTITGGPSSDLS